MKDKKMYIGSRTSHLAKKQTDLVVSALKKIGIVNVKIKFIKTKSGITVIGKTMSWVVMIHTVQVKPLAK